LNRQEIIRQYQNNPEVTVLIVGAGINGIGTFRDQALQGVDVLLIDRGDYCSGASSASSHMVHGGIRYLENGEFRLVREAVQERNRLLENAPHLVKPLQTVFPIFKWFSGLFNAPLKFLGVLNNPAERGAIVIKLGMLLYDLFTRSQATVPRHRFLSRRISLKKFPKLNPEVIFTGIYYDAAMHSPERICMELIGDARRQSSNAMALNYMSLISAGGESVILKDEVSGEKFTVKPKIVINAAGPWVDIVNGNIGVPSRFIGGTKGSHLVLDNPELQRTIGDCEFFFENNDGRIVLIYPLKDKVLIGTSDIRIDDPDTARCTDEEVGYFFDMVRRVFPTVILDRSQIVFRFSGVRPLPFKEVGVTGQISRDHSIEVVNSGDGIDFPVFSLIGGKWTTFRAFSEAVTDMVLHYLGEKRLVNTQSIPIGGGRDCPKTEVKKVKWLSRVVNQTGIQPKRMETLFDRYGTQAKVLAEFVVMKEDRFLNANQDYSRREIAYLVENEDVIHLDDLVLRRVMFAKLGELTRNLISELAGIVGEVLGWDDEQQESEIERTKEILMNKHGVDFG
jgi:glycerol-3-phosphate dehydrogenase